MPSWYILQVERNEADEDWFYLVGPFGDEGTALDWAECPQNVRDERWCVLKLGELRRFAVFERHAIPIEIASPQSVFAGEEITGEPEAAIIERVKAARHRPHHARPK